MIVFFLNLNQNRSPQISTTKDQMLFVFLFFLLQDIFFFIFFFLPPQEFERTTAVVALIMAVTLRFCLNKLFPGVTTRGSDYLFHFKKNPEYMTYQLTNKNTNLPGSRDFPTYQELLETCETVNY